MKLEDIYQHVIDGNAGAVEAGVKAALASGVDANIILQDALIKAMAEVGQRFENGDFFVPEMLIAASAMKAGLEILRPQLAAANVKALGKVVIGTVQGDLHDIGKNLVSMMLEGAGFEVIDLGADVSPVKFAQAIREHKPQFVGMSALLTTTMPRMKDTIEAIEDMGLRRAVKVMVGGAPVTEKYAQQIGADIYAPDASSAARLARQLVA